MKYILKKSQLFGLRTLTWTMTLHLKSLQCNFLFAWFFKLLAKFVNYFNTLQMLVHNILMLIDAEIQRVKTNYKYNDLH